jgi:hypothetical protein
MRLKIRVSVGIWFGRAMEARETRLAVRDSDLPQICKAKLDMGSLTIWAQ